MHPACGAFAVFAMRNHPLERIVGSRHVVQRSSLARLQRWTMVRPVFSLSALLRQLCEQTKTACSSMCGRRLQLHVGACLLWSGFTVAVF